MFSREIGELLHEAQGGKIFVSRPTRYLERVGVGTKSRGGLAVRPNFSIIATTRRSHNKANEREITASTRAPPDRARLLFEKF